jgi:protein involved in polysaccharide export with SLBB domain
MHAPERTQEAESSSNETAMKSRQALRGHFSLLALVAALGGVVAAQTPPRGTPSEFETRADLEAQLKIAESGHRTSEAWLLRNRLEKGDFQEGDRLVVNLHTSAATQTSETLTVRAGKIVQFPKMDDLSLDGVLRSEVRERFMMHLSKYLQDSAARVTPLMRINMMGAVGRPGFYDTSADLLLSDMVMRAGGPTGDADLNKVTIRRATTVIWGEKDTRTALADGLSLDRLHLRAGDQIEVGARRHIQWFNAISLGLGLITLGVTLIRFR